MISHTLDEFWDCYKALPQNVRESARRAYAKWQVNHYHPSLHFKCVKDSAPPLYSARTGLDYRALGVREKQEDQDIITWFWIGTHAEYEKLIESF